MPRWWLRETQVSCRHVSVSSVETKRPGNDAKGTMSRYAAMVELVDTLDSKSGEHYARAGSSPARGTKT